MFWIWCLCLFAGNMNLVLLLTSLLLGNSTPHVELSIKQDPLIQENPAWEQYKVEFEKSYDNHEEEAQRMEIFMENSRLIEEHNELYEKGHYSFQLGHNQFSDLTHQEYLDQYTNLQDRENQIHEEANEENNNPEEYFFKPPENIHLPFSIDWRGLGAVTPVKTEGHCAASWAFSATGALEGQQFRRYHHLIPLSEQNLVDCTAKYGNHGCSNGTAANAYRYIIANGGINNNYSYPWAGKKSWLCHYRKLHSNPRIRGIVHIDPYNETILQIAVATVGPIATAVDARSIKFKFYRQGIFYEPTCSAHLLTRELLVVGYTHQYWIVKNSWGIPWGVNGYIYMSRTGQNQCGIATRPVYPLV